VAFRLKKIEETLANLGAGHGENVELLQG
jgi:hypothetical protein